MTSPTPPIDANKFEHKVQIESIWLDPEKGCAGIRYSRDGCRFIQNGLEVHPLGTQADNFADSGMTVFCISLIAPKDAPHPIELGG